VRAPADRVADDLGPDREVAHGGAALLDDAGEARSLAGGELEGQPVDEVAPPDEVLDVVEARADDLDDDLVVGRRRQRLLDEVQLGDVSVPVELDGLARSCHDVPPLLSSRRRLCRREGE
jgi:nucleotide-binding universal stress UspA family protein